MSSVDEKLAALLLDIMDETFAHCRHDNRVFRRAMRKGLVQVSFPSRRRYFWRPEGSIYELTEEGTAWFENYTDPARQVPVPPQVPFEDLEWN